MSRILFKRAAAILAASAVVGLVGATCLPAIAGAATTAPADGPMLYPRAAAASGGLPANSSGIGTAGLIGAGDGTGSLSYSGALSAVNAALAAK